MSNSTWPIAKFRFEVDFGLLRQGISFQEVSGLEAETQNIEYRASDNGKEFSTIKMPGVAKYGNVTMKRGIFVKDDTFWAWFNQIKMNTIKRETVIIKLLDESDHVTMKQTLSKAWPIKITGVDLNSDGNEVAVETLEMAHEGLTISNYQQIQ